MSEITHAQVAMYAVAAVLVVVLGVRYMHRQAAVANRAPVASAGAAGDSKRNGAPGGAGAPATVRIDAVGGGPALVHVAGAVRRPGVYRLSAGGRVQDAVRRAGGGTGAADVNAVNLAAKVADGQQVIVPRRASAGPAGAAAGGVPTAASGAGASAGGATAAPVNLNTATAEQLETLDGVGPATAEKILDFRRQHGGFRTIEDLAQVPGIGPKRLAALREKVQL